jgi:hypothetical protein
MNEEIYGALFTFSEGMLVALILFNDDIGFKKVDNEVS